MNKIHDFLRKQKRRYYIWKYGLTNVSKSFIASKGCKISRDFKAGEYSFVGTGCMIYPNVSIGNYTLIAHDTSILGGDHVFKEADIPIMFQGRDKIKPTVIGTPCWIGAYSIIMSGRNIGDGAIVAAGSVVTKNIPKNEIWGGNPAKFIKKRFNSCKEEELHEQMVNTPPRLLAKKYKVLSGKL